MLVSESLSLPDAKKDLKKNYRVNNDIALQQATPETPLPPFRYATEP